MSVQEQSPVALLDRAVEVAGDESVELGDEQQDVWISQLGPKKPLIALLDGLDEHEAVGVEPMVLANQKRRQPRSGIEMVLLEIADDEVAHADSLRRPTTTDNRPIAMHPFARSPLAARRFTARPRRDRARRLFGAGLP